MSGKLPKLLQGFLEELRLWASADATGSRVLHSLSNLLQRLALLSRARRGGAEGLRLLGPLREFPDFAHRLLQAHAEEFSKAQAALAGTVQSALRDAQERLARTAHAASAAAQHLSPDAADASSLAQPASASAIVSLIWDLRALVANSMDAEQLADAGEQQLDKQVELLQSRANEWGTDCLEERLKSGASEHEPRDLDLEELSERAWKATGGSSLVDLLCPPPS
jgi:hypothetical protein